ncbi:glycosyltransferase family 4 protein [Corynebacterium afermentans subsp. lipophilum]|uniref:glycosyltransferase family 4 protein n=1 Tax=Corynebacterium afermentans TaxID=38286 RepID=UPI00188C3D93|nr:glycosyltransferase family 4 protein [Corynebacterium afermentans]MBF4546994.1 glycosyltransferase family 4 protein [Corynebacterium afermentans subsp. lipophilum]WJY59356.1 putative glycosyl transferase [Corynebacterium afermentans subsp. lipophilum]
MRILVLSQYWWPENGVPQRRWSWLTNHLKDLGHEVVVVAPPPHYNRELSFRDYVNSIFDRQSVYEVGPDGEKIWRCGYLPSSKSLTYRALNQGYVAISTVITSFRQRRSDGFRPDLVIGTVPALPTAMAAYLVGCIFNRPYIIDLRDAWPDLLDYSSSWNAGTGRKSLRERVLRWGPLQLVSKLTHLSLQFCYEHSTAMILTSDYLKQRLSERMDGNGLDPKPDLATIRNVFPPRSTPEIKEAKTTGDKLRVLYAGTLGRAQQLSNAIEAVRIAKARGCAVELHLVGAGATSAALRTMIRGTELPVRIYQRLGAEEMADHYEWADTALVHLADWEPLKAAVPSKTFELIQLGIHISGAIQGETADIIRKLKAGDVVPPNDPEALAELWCELSRDRTRLAVGDGPAKALHYEESIVVPDTLRMILDKATGR